MKHGAYHYANKPFNLDEIALLVDKAGTLWVGTGLPNFTNDQQTLDELPMDYIEVIEDLAVVKLCQMRP